MYGNISDVKEHSHSMEEEINSLRLLVLMECEGHFHQVELTPEQFKTVSDTVGCTKHTTLPLPVPERPEVEERFVHMGDWKIDADHFLGLEDWYTDQHTEDEED